MNRIIRKAALVLAIVVILSGLTGCKEHATPTRENPLLGVWKDTYDFTEYEFLDDKNLKLVTIGIASFDGTYEIHDDQMTIRISMLGTVEEKTYQYRFEGDRFFLNETEFVRKSP